MPLRTSKLSPFLPLIAAIALCAASVLVSLTLYRGFGFVINYTDSLPKGLYRLYPVTEINRNTLVALHVPEPFRDMVYGRGWLIKGGLLIKPVAAAKEDSVHIDESGLYINSRYFGPVFKNDPKGLPLPRAAASYKLKEGELFLASPYERSFDSRYFGSVTQDKVVAEVKSVWTF